MSVGIREVGKTEVVHTEGGKMEVINVEVYKVSNTGCNQQTYGQGRRKKVSCILRDICLVVR